MAEYKTLIAKIAEDQNDKMDKACKSSRKSFAILRDVFMGMAMVVFLPLLEIVHHLVKFSQSRDKFVCAYLAAVKICQAQVYKLYANPKITFVFDEFYDFKALLDDHHDNNSCARTSSSLDLNDLGG